MPAYEYVTTVELVSPTGSTVVALKPTAVTWTRDEATSPFLTAAVTVGMPTAAQYAMMRPGAGYFLRITAYETVSIAQPYVLKITDRTRTTTGLVELQAASAEIELQGYMPSTVDRSFWSAQTDAKLLAFLVCDQVFGSDKWDRWNYDPADAFGLDVDGRTYLTYRALTNLITNPSFETGTAGWTATRSAIRTQAWSGGLGPNMGTNTLRIEGSGSNNDTFASTPVDLQPNTQYTLSGYVLNGAVMSSANQNARRLVVVITVNGAAQVLTATPAGANTVNGITRVSITFSTPATVDSGGSSIRAYNGTTTGTSNPVLWDGIMLVEGTRYDTDTFTEVPFFDGDVADGTRGYNYDWTGTAGSSTSTRTPVVARDPDALTWSPGQSAWDYLQPILQATGIRIWSHGYNTDWSPGKVVAVFFLASNQFGLSKVPRRALQGYNLLDVSQVDSWSAEFSDGTPMYADQVIVKYLWTDALNSPQEKYDVYPATGKKPYYLELQDTPYAGPGRARGIYNRIVARATMLQGITWFDRSLEPGAQLSVTADALGGSAIGYVEAVTLDPFRGTTEFRTKQTVEYTSASWFLATGSWASQTGSWAADI